MRDTTGLYPIHQLTHLAAGMDIDMFKYMPRPGTLESMQGHPVCKCTVCSEFSARCIREIADESRAIRLQLQPTPAASLMVLGNGTSDDSDSDDDFGHEKLAQ